MNADDDSARYLWPARWDEFQHYPPEPDRGPAWIKNYAKQLDDDAYLDLTLAQRGLLADLRLEFSKARARLRLDRRRLTLRLGATVYQRDLQALNQAGFLEIISRATLEQRLEQLYSRSSPRARPRSRGEVEGLKDLEPTDRSKTTPPKPPVGRTDTKSDFDPPTPNGAIEHHGVDPDAAAKINAMLEHAKPKEL
jgi:hypothetical protein